MQLKNNDRVAIVGGGPAGSFFARELLRKSKSINLELDVVIIEKRTSKNLENGNCHLKGCTFGAGGISPRLNEMLEKDGYKVPEKVKQGNINYIWVHGQWKNFRLRVPDDMQMYSVFRGSLPAGRGPDAFGFDEFLLSEAVKEGAHIIHSEVQSINYSKNRIPVLTLKNSAGEIDTLDAGFVTIASGINTRCGLDYSDNPLIASIKNINPAFVPGKTRRSFLFELDVGEEYLNQYMNNEIHFIEYGSKTLSLEHTALLPKGRYLSVAMIGQSIDNVALPQQNKQIIQDFFNLPQINRILPEIKDAPVSCACFPRMAVVPARNPYSDRLALIGDAAGSRLNKDGLFSAHMTANHLVQSIFKVGIDKNALALEYGKTIKWLTTNNIYGNIVFNASRIAFSWPAISRIMYQSFATEFKIRDKNSRPIGAILWKIASGTCDYANVLREMFNYKALKSIFIGTMVTMRNVAFEFLFNLKWGISGRYPTVVLKEKRQTVKNLLSSKLGINLDKNHDFERMYVIKIKGSGNEIQDELAKFGCANSEFLHLRFVRIRQIHGTPNQIGSVIQYKIPLIGLGTEMRLNIKSKSGTFLYQLNEILSNNGKLIFDVSPTADGNSKLSIYAAFDYKKGNNIFSKTFWYLTRVLFPAFVHDVAWNHALCTIKEKIEFNSKVRFKFSKSADKNNNLNPSCLTDL